MPVGFMVLSALGSDLLWIWSAPWVVAGTPQLCSCWPAAVSKNGASLPSKAAGAAATDGAEAQTTKSEFWASFPHLLSAIPLLLPCVIPKPFSQCVAQILTYAEDFSIYIFFFFFQANVCQNIVPQAKYCFLPHLTMGVCSLIPPVSVIRRP